MKHVTGKSLVAAVLLSLSFSNVARAGSYTVPQGSNSRVATHAAATRQSTDLATQVGRLVEGRALKTIKAPNDFSAKSQLTSMTQQVLKQQLLKVPGLGGVLAASADVLVPVIVNQVWTRISDKLVTRGKVVTPGNPVTNPVRRGTMK